jgi:hypothetical protein
MRRVLVDECLAVLDTVCDVIFYLGKYYLAIPTIVWTNVAIFILDQFELLPSYHYFIKIRFFIERSSFL